MSNVFNLTVKFKNNKLQFRFYASGKQTIRRIDKVLVANRGEIACRVMKTATKMGIRTVAVYSDVDATAYHTKMADEAYHIGASPALESYLNAQKLIHIAKLSGAQAIHPGYGFLSENAAFADLVAKSGLIFIGPPSSAITAMGSKTASKEIMIKAGVPCVPGYHGPDQSLENFLTEAEKIGYPVMLKAALGGGGKGMRIVHNRDEMSFAMESCQREGLKSFGSDDLLIEKYIARPRHIEVQVFADHHGNCVYLFERDCSVQRRHQKIIEEAPAPGISPEFRRHIGEAAVNCAKAVGYVGAGTVEFIAEGDKFYFMEMNTRLQVEHPITEMITRQDLVKWQIKVAEGHPLPLQQSDLKIQGHAFEARVYAENPKNDFLPGSGKIELLLTPEQNENVRVDTGIVQGDEISVFYDPMIAKLIVWDEDRHAALRRLSLGLSQYHIGPIITNIQFLQTLALHPDFQAGNVHTGFIKEHEKSLFEEETKQDLHKAVAIASIAKEMSGKNPIEKSLVPTNFTMASHSYTSVIQKVGHNLFDVTVVCVPTSESICYRNVMATYKAPHLDVHLDGRFIKSIVFLVGDDYHVKFESRHFNVVTHEKLQHTATTAHTVSLKAPMPGRIIKVLVQKGDFVKKGQAVVILEAMKMEHKINSPKDGVVKTITYQDNDVVQLGATMLVLEEK